MHGFACTFMAANNDRTMHSVVRGVVALQNYNFTESLMCFVSVVLFFFLAQNNSFFSVVLAITSIIICVYPPSFANSFMEFDPLPETGYRLFILVIGFICAVCAYLYETYFIDHLILNVRERFFLKIFIAHLIIFLLQ